MEAFQIEKALDCDRDSAEALARMIQRVKEEKIAVEGKVNSWEQKEFVGIQNVWSKDWGERTVVMANYLGKSLALAWLALQKEGKVYLVRYGVATLIAEKL